MSEGDGRSSEELQKRREELRKRCAERRQKREEAAARAQPRLEAGRRRRREVLGDAHVDRAEAATTPFDADFQRYITEAAWGSLWTRPNLTLRERSLITIALLAAFGHHEELALHTRATANTGASPDDLKDVLLHVAAYGGIPAANSAMRVVRATLEEMEQADDP